MSALTSPSWDEQQTLEFPPKKKHSHVHLGGLPKRMWDWHVLHVAFAQPIFFGKRSKPRAFQRPLKMHAAFPSLPVPKPVKLTLIHIRKARTKSVQIPATSPRNRNS